MSRCHVAADLGAIGHGNGDFVDDMAAADHQQTVGKLQQFVEIVAGDQHRRTGIARGHGRV